MEEGKPKGTEEVQHMSIVFAFYIHLHLAAWIKLPDLRINMFYLLSVNKDTVSSALVPFGTARGCCLSSE